MLQYGCFFSQQVQMVNKYGCKYIENAIQYVVFPIISHFVILYITDYKWVSYWVFKAGSIILSSSESLSIVSCLINLHWLISAAYKLKWKLVIADSKFYQKKKLKERNRERIKEMKKIIEIWSFNKIWFSKQSKMIWSNSLWM